MKLKDENEGGDYKTCPSCSLPHRMTDTVCSYCGEKLPDKVTVSERMRRVVGRARWRYKLATAKKRSDKKKGGDGTVARGLGLVICAALIAVGLWFMYSAVKSEGFSDFIIAVTLLLYGGGSGYNILKKR